MEIHTAIAASCAATAQACPAWLKNATQATFLLLLTKSVIWLAAAWLAFRGF